MKIKLIYNLTTMYYNLHYFYTIPTRNEFFEIVVIKALTRWSVIFTCLSANITCSFLLTLTKTMTGAISTAII